MAEQSSITSTHVTIDEVLGAIHRAYDMFAEQDHVFPNDLIVLAQQDMVEQLCEACTYVAVNDGALYGAKLYTAKNMFDRSMMLILHPESIFMACKTSEDMIEFSNPEFHNTHIQAIYLDGPY